jgi:hypothetical protein
MFTTPNHGPDGKIAMGFVPTMHIMYPSGCHKIPDNLPKYDTLPAAFGGSDKKVDAEIAMAVPKNSLSIEFEQGVIHIEEKPLGLSFLNTMPLTVKNIEENCTGGMAGVQPGWVFKTIGGKDCGSDFLGANQMLKQGLEGLPVAASEDTSATLPIKFLLPNGFIKKVNFNRKPLGLKFDKVLPLTVKGTMDGSISSELAVQAGWVFRNIDGKEIVAGKTTVDEIIQMITQGCAKIAS